MPEDKAIPTVESIKRKLTHFSLQIDPATGVKTGIAGFTLATRYADGKVETKPAGHVQLDEAKLATVFTAKVFGDLRTFVQAEADTAGL